jgi:branched-chain amino acid transport system ATP-binding protein
MSTLLKMDDVHAAYGHAQALFGMGFEVKAGEVITLLGRNGMGRSTTIKCLFGMLPVKSGAITFAGKSLTSMASHGIARLGLGLVPEGRQVFPSLSVEENLIATARAPRHGQASLAPWNLDRVYRLFPRLQERRDNHGWQLSGGEQQMLAIGRALMTNPQILVLDEATEGLAPIIRTEIWAVLAQLKRDGLAQIVIDKNVGALLKLADRHFVMEKGKVVWQGDSDQLRSEPGIVQQYMGVS